MSTTVSTKSAAFRETAAALGSPSWKTLGFATRSLNRLLAVELLPTPDVPAGRDPRQLIIRTSDDEQAGAPCGGSSTVRRSG